jgi:hypothetical protein
MGCIHHPAAKFMTIGIYKSYQRQFKQYDPPISIGRSVTVEMGTGIIPSFWVSGRARRHTEGQKARTQ